MPSSDQELVRTAQSWSIRDQDLIGQVSCTQPYEWRDPTAAEWEFAPGAAGSNGSKPFHVRWCRAALPGPLPAFAVPATSCMERSQRPLPACAAPATGCTQPLDTSAARRRWHQWLRAALIAETGQTCAGRLRS